MTYYRDQVTQKSWQILTSLASKYQFVLIGGWAVWLYTKQLKSKDIDIVVGLDQLGRLSGDYDLVKNDRLHKYEIRQEEIQIDVYTPFYSKLGIPTENILSLALNVEGFKVPPPETLLSLKLVAYQGRKGSDKGRKDLVDMVSLLCLPRLNFAQIPPEVIELASSQTQIPELLLNSHQYSKCKKLWKNYAGQI
jgi:hypothetical protein